MRLNRNSAIFIALLALVIIVALIFLQGDDTDNNQPIVEATAVTIQLFPTVADANVIALSVSQEREVGDLRPTPIPGNATLVPPTDLPEDIDPPMTTDVSAFNRDSTTATWLVSDTSTQTITGTVDSAQIDTAVRALVSLQSNRQFTPEDGDYSQFGLDMPTYDIRFTEQPIAETGVAAEGDAAPTGEPVNYRLRIGNSTVGENAFYAFLNDDEQTIYVITNATTLRNSILNLATTVPIEPTAVPTAIPVLNTQAPFASFVLTNATGFTFTNNETGDVILISRNAEGTGWTFNLNGEELAVQPEFLQVILNSFSTVRGVDQVATTDLAVLGLDNPTYRLEAGTVGNIVYILQLGDQDPTGSVYYGLVNQFEEVALIDSDSVALLLSLFDTPPVIEPEVTPEATESPEITPEATETSE
ncbi:MAG: DUF4340 domain-containing protein [Phototrophicaceae bacterium]